MLIQFNFKNFKSFRDEASLDLSATKITDFSERVVITAGEKILPVAAIYGANASGKSNVYGAFVCMSRLVLTSFDFGDDADLYEENLPTRFAFDVESEEADSSFEVYFTVPGETKERIYNYGFCLGEDGVTEEWLNYRAKTARDFRMIFYRGEKTLDLSGIPQNSRENIKIALEKQVLIASLGAKLKVEKCKLVRDWFLANRIEDFANVVENFYTYSRIPKGFEKDEKVRKSVVKYFASFDDAIKEFEVEQVPVENEEEQKKDRYIIHTLHKKAGSKEMAEILLRDESAGTLKMFALFPSLQTVLQQGSVFFIDELNARLHPLLVRNFLLMFLDPEINVNHAQLVFTTHESWLMSGQFLRRDEIWFTEKDEMGASTLYSLVDLVDEAGARIRKDENFEKNYMQGKYGAIPNLKRMDQFTES